MDTRIFLVEDLTSMHVLLGDLFRSIGGFQLAGTATTEAEARLWLTDHPGEWDVAIVDLVLQQGSGFSVIEHAAAQTPRGRIVAFSGFASPAVREQCIRLGADAVFDKAQTSDFISWLVHQSGNGRGGRGSIAG